MSINTCRSHVRSPWDDLTASSTPDSSISMSQPGPRVRSACEACHTRKQRCILPDAGGACQACVQNSRQCYFVPRFRPGRPQRRQTDDRCNRSSNTNTSSSGSSGRGAPSPAAVSPLVNPDVLLNSYIDQGGDASIPCLNLGLQKPASEIAVIELDEYQENMQGLWDTGSAFNFNPNGMDIPDSLQLLTGTASLGETFPGDDLRLHGEAPIDCSPGSKLARQFIHLDSQRESLLPSYAKPMGCEDFCKKIEPCMDTIAYVHTFLQLVRDTDEFQQNMPSSIDTRGKVLHES